MIDSNQPSIELRRVNNGWILLLVSAANYDRGASAVAVASKVDDLLKLVAHWAESQETKPEA